VGAVTPTQLGAFVLVARLGPIRAAAGVLGLGGPAVSKASALQMVSLAAEAPTKRRSGAVASKGKRPWLVCPSGTGPETDRGRARLPARYDLLLNFLATPDAMQIMCSTGVGVAPSRFYVTIWS
jgi:hypothetical protein